MVANTLILIAWIVTILFIWDVAVSVMFNFMRQEDKSFTGFIICSLSYITMYFIVIGTVVMLPTYAVLATLYWLFM